MYGHGVCGRWEHKVSCLKPCYNLRKPSELAFRLYCILYTLRWGLCQPVEEHRSTACGHGTDVFRRDCSSLRVSSQLRHCTQRPQTRQVSRQPVTKENFSSHFTFTQEAPHHFHHFSLTIFKLLNDWQRFLKLAE